MTVAAVARALVFVIVFTVAQLVIQLCIQAILRELGNGFLKQILDIVNAADACHLRQLTELLSTGIFFGVRFFLAICKTSCAVLLFYTKQEVYTNFGIVSPAAAVNKFYSIRTYNGLYTKFDIDSWSTAIVGILSSNYYSYSFPFSTSDNAR